MLGERLGPASPAGLAHTLGSPVSGPRGVPLAPWGPAGTTRGTATSSTNVLPAGVHLGPHTCAPPHTPHTFTMRLSAAFLWMHPRFPVRERGANGTDVRGVAFSTPLRCCGRACVRVCVCVCVSGRPRVSGGEEVAQPRLRTAASPCTNQSAVKVGSERGGGEASRLRGQLRKRRPDQPRFPRAGSADFPVSRPIRSSKHLQA